MKMQTKSISWQAKNVQELMAMNAAQTLQKIAVDADIIKAIALNQKERLSNPDRISRLWKHKVSNRCLVKNVTCRNEER